MDRLSGSLVEETDFKLAGLTRHLSPVTRDPGPVTRDPIGARERGRTREWRLDFLDNQIDRLPGSAWYRALLIQDCAIGTDLDSASQ